MTTVDLSAPDRTPLHQRARLWITRHSMSLYALALTVILGLLAIAPSIFIEVQAGHVGVLWLRFFGGTVTNRVLNEGTHMVFPWDKVTMYDVRLRTDSRSYEAVSANGMAMTVDVALRYRINPPAAGLVHKLAGDDYATKLVYPEIASLVYEFVSQHSPESFYSVNRADIQGFLLKRIQEQFPAPPDNFPMSGGATPQQVEAAMIRVEDVLVAGVTFPPLVRLAIDRKMEQQQIMQEYEFRIAREAKERDRKRIEAEGIRDFQDIVARNITPEYLRLRGIEATRAFATSTNAKTIIIGGRDGLPVILNTGDDAKPAASALSSSSDGAPDAASGNPADRPPESSALPSDPADTPRH